MGTKLPHHDGSMPSGPASRRTPKHPSKRRKSNDSVTPATKITSVNQLKSKIRDLTRVLEHSEHLPPGVRIEKERALAGYKQDVEKIHIDKRKNELIKKYHMVRFFGGSFLALARLNSSQSVVLNPTVSKERQKATRALKKLQRRLDASSSELPEYNQLAKEVQDAKIDVFYTMYHPLTEKYQSLFPRQGITGREGAARKLVTKKPALWKVVEQCTADGTLEALRDGKLATRIPVSERKTTMEKPRSKGESKNGRNGSQSSKSAAPQKQDEGSDGGFFEE